MATQQSSLPKQYADALACPSCGSERLIPTKEKIIICQACFTGYRMNQGMPDFRLEHAISFKSRVGGRKKGLDVSVTVLMGEDKAQRFDVAYGHCIVLGRKINPDVNVDLTVVMKTSQVMYTNLDPHNHQLIEKYLSKGNRETLASERALQTQQKFLGHFIRDPDFMLSDPSISRTHAVVYQDENGLNILDLYSKNGTYVNGYEIESCRLRHNDVISLGTASLKVSLY